MVEASREEILLTHTCHAANCNKQIPPNMFMCREHWRMVPPLLKSEIWRTYRPGQEIDKTPSPEYLDAAKKAIAAVPAQERPQAEELPISLSTGTRVSNALGWTGVVQKVVPPGKGLNKNPGIRRSVAARITGRSINCVSSWPTKRFKRASCWCWLTPPIRLKPATTVCISACDRVSDLSVGIVVGMVMQISMARW